MKTENSEGKNLRKREQNIQDDAGPKCEACNKTFSSYNNFRRHILKFHPSLEKIAPLKKSTKTYKFKCELCNRQYNSKKNYLAHKRKQHEIVNRTVKCGLCQEDVAKGKFPVHLKESHNIDLAVYSIEFCSFEEFMKWKTALEMELNMRFIKKCGNKKTSGGEEELRYFCHRSGSYIGRGKGLQRIKSQGSKKINSYCPASLKVVKRKNGVCCVRYVETHVGHGSELCYVTLTSDQRKLLVSKMTSRIHLKDILNEARQSSNSRLKSLTKKDLLNIRRKYNVKQMEKQSSSETSSIKEETHCTLPHLSEFIQEDTPSITSMSTFQAAVHDRKTKILETVKILIDSIITENELEIFRDGFTSVKESLQAYQANLNKELKN